MDQNQSIVQEAVRQVTQSKEGIGYLIDTALAGGALGAYLISIEQILGGLLAALIALVALATAIYRFLYWRAKSRRAVIALGEEAEDARTIVKAAEILARKQIAVAAEEAREKLARDRP